MIGIYKITSPSGKIYIGQSVNLESRLRRYKNMSIKTQGQTKIWRSLKKYGAEMHTYEIIHECKESELNTSERYYQEKFDCVDNGLNCRYTKTNDKSGKVSEETRRRMSEVQKGNQNFLGKKHTEETKNKIRLKKLGKRFSDEVNISKGRKGRKSPMKGLFGKHNPISKKIAQYSLDNVFIKEWDSAMDVKRELGFNNTNISSCCSGKLKTSSGFIWKYV